MSAAFDGVDLLLIVGMSLVVWRWVVIRRREERRDKQCDVLG